jgi:hypothetical protein
MQGMKLARDNADHAASLQSLAKRGFPGVQHLCHRLGKTTCGPKPKYIPRHKREGNGEE